MERIEYPHAPSASGLSYAHLRAAALALEGVNPDPIPGPYPVLFDIVSSDEYQL